MIKCFPNPTTGKVSLSGLPLNETYNIRIYSIDGRLIVSNKERNPSEIDLSHMNAGIYLIQITGEKANTTLKLIKI
ncbi:MAG: T9SS type A sorting domain-containing protein [Saprospiraceae bacterium]|nr:T9SS type A sorting domain-containing protein [Candidatus Brachybacter algidus]